MSQSLVLTETKDFITTITLNRPDQSNALNKELIHALIEQLKIAEDDKDCRCIVLKGAGKNFCAGGDIDDMINKAGMFAGESNELRNLYAQNIQQIPRQIESMQTPIIAHVDGAAVGAGCDLACMCDIRVGGPRAKIGEVFANLSLISGDGGAFFLSRIVGYAKALEMFLTCEVYDAKTCFEIGLLNYQFDDEAQAEKKTQDLATLIASKAPVANGLTKQLMKQVKNSALEQHLELAAAYQGITQRTSDHFEGLKAFKEKRKPNFTGL